MADELTSRQTERIEFQRELIRELIAEAYQSIVSTRREIELDEQYIQQRERDIRIYETNIARIEDDSNHPVQPDDSERE